MGQATQLWVGIQRIISLQNLWQTWKKIDSAQEKKTDTHKTKQTITTKKNNPPNKQKTPQTPNSKALNIHIRLIP